MTAPRFITLFTLLSLLLGTGHAIAQDAGPGVQGDPGTPDLEGGGAALVGTGFTYQGWLQSGGIPVSGDCDFQFSLWDSLSSGVQQGSTQGANSVAVAGGRFTVVLNDTGLFGARAFDGSARWLGIAVQCPTGMGGFTPLTPRQALTASPLALALPGLRTEINATSPNVVGGHISNTVGVGVVGAVIAGGGGSGQANSVTADYGTVGGGYLNTTSNYFDTVGGGASNTASGSQATAGGGSNNTASGASSTVGGGSGNTASGVNAAVGGGLSNHASGTAATVGGGESNTGSSSRATVGGGQFNTASGFGATVGGGVGNTASGIRATVAGGGSNIASDDLATVGGGSGNTASGLAATVAGGIGNTASGLYSFAAGWNARALHIGAFVWADSTGTVISSTGANQMLIRASGGVTIYTNAAITAGVALMPGAGSWTTISDRNAKANFERVDGVAVLNALMGLPIETWNYHTQDAATRHIGPMAQDFYAAFGVGETDLGISTVDADGVALAAIQGLYAIVQAQQAEIDALREQAALGAGAVETGRQAQSYRAPVSTEVLLLLAGAVIGAGAYALGRRREQRSVDRGA